MNPLRRTAAGLTLFMAAAALAGCGRSAEVAAGNEEILHPADLSRPSPDSLENENRRLRDQVNALAAENRVLTGRLADLEARATGSRHLPRTPAAEQPAPSRTNQAAAPRTEPTPAPGTPSGTGSGTAPAAQGADRMAGYNAALKTLRARNYGEAVRQFEDLLSQSIGPDLSDNCHYWIGEAYYAQKKYDLAAQEFQTVMDYPASDKVRDAMLMLGSARAAAGKRDEARAAWENLTKKYPGSSAAKRAQAKLDQLK